MTAKYSLQVLNTEQKNNALLGAAKKLCEKQDEILAANNIDIENGEKNGMHQGLLDRLRLTPERIEAMAEGLRQIVELPDCIGEVLESFERPIGMRIEKKRVPLGVIGIIYEAVRKQQTLVIKYQSFHARQPQELVVYPYLLKEFRNRWFLICEKARNRTPQVNIFALDRMQSVRLDKEHPFKQCIDFDPAHFYDDTIGVTKQIRDKARRVVLIVDSDQAPYIETKPFHRSQKVEERYADGSIKMSLRVVLNNELERLILGFGRHIEVVSPPELRGNIAYHVRMAYRHYENSWLSDDFGSVGKE